MPRLSTGAVPALVLAVGTLILFVGGGARFAVGLALTAIDAELGSGRTTIGIAVAAFQIVSAGAMFWAGRFADRTDPGRVLAIGLACAALGIGATGVAGTSWQLVILYGVVFALGTGVASLIPVGVLINRHYPARAGLANSVALAGMASGQLVMILGLNAVMLQHGWRSIFLWLGLAHLVVAPLALLATGGRLGGGATSAAAMRAGPASGDITLREALSTRRLWLLLAVYALCGFEDFFVTTHVVAFAMDKGADALLAGNLLAFMGLTALIGVVLSGWSADRWGPVAAALASFVLRALLFAYVLVDQRPASVAVFALLFGATFLMTAPLAIVFVRQAFGGGNLGAFTGLITMVHHIFGGFGALLGAALFDARGSYDLVLWLMLGSSLLAAWLTIGLRPAAFSDYSGASKTP